MNCSTRKVKKNKIYIPLHEIIRYMCIRQDIAAEKLGVSISTLKRRYYELRVGRWPVDSSCEMIDDSSMDRTKISTLLNETHVDAREIDTASLRIIFAAFEFSGSSS